MFKDRSLGSVELRVADLATRSDDSTFPYKSVGKKTAVEPLRQDRGNSYKGNLHYVAEFVPAIALKGINFSSGPNEIQQVIGSSGYKDDDSSSISSSDLEHEAVPEGITATRPLGHHELKSMQKKDSESIDSQGTADTEDTAQTAETGGTNKSEGTGAGSGPGSAEKPGATVEMSKEGLLKHREYRLSHSCACAYSHAIYAQNTVLSFSMSAVAISVTRAVWKFCLMTHIGRHSALFVLVAPMHNGTMSAKASSKSSTLAVCGYA